jgi:hypothetical protein
MYFDEDTLNQALPENAHTDGGSNISSSSANTFSKF